MNKALIQQIKEYAERFDYEKYFYKKMDQMIKKTINIYGLDICFNDFYYLYLKFDNDFKNYDIYTITNKEKIQVIKECVKKIYINNKYDINELIQLNIIKKIFNVNLLEIIPKLSFKSLEQVKKVIDLYQLANTSTHIPRQNKIKLLIY